MKKFLSLLLILVYPLLSMAQLQPGQYKIRLAKKTNLIIQSRASNPLELLTECSGYNLDCGYQIWTIKAVPGRPRCYTIQLTQNNKFITWQNDGGTAQLPGTEIKLESSFPIAKKQFQQFLISTDKDVVAIMPDVTTPGVNANEYFLGGDLSAGLANGTGIILDVKNERFRPRTFNNLDNIYWEFQKVSVSANVSGITTAGAAGNTGALLRNADNALYVDIRTGDDNLEPRDFQHNPSITLQINGKPDIVVENINNNETWVNNSFKRVTIPLPATVRKEDLRNIVIKRMRKDIGRFDITHADNWTVSNVKVTGKFNKQLVNIVEFKGMREYRRVFRFKWGSINTDETGSENMVHGYGQTVTLSLTGGGDTAPAAPPTSPEDGAASITAVFGTGGDDLRGGNDNVNLLIRFKSGRLPITIFNLNKRRNWPNLKQTTVIEYLPNSNNIDFNDIKDVVIRHTGGGGFGADNWYLDKFVLTITKDGQSKILIDKVMAPIHYFTGEARTKTLVVE